MVKTIGIVLVTAHEVGRSTGRGDNRDSAPHEVISECGKTIILAIRPSIFDDDILAVDIPGFL